jgi:hypothetical protein
MQLLTIGNPKTAKGASRGYLTAVLHLAPWKASGVNVCPMAELAACHVGCLNTAGRGGIAAGRATYNPHGVELPANAIQRARITRTQLFSAQREAFMAQLVSEIARHVRRAKRLGLTACVRLNGTSDIRWEDIPCGTHANVFAAFPAVQFYDYTKIPNRGRHGLPANYYLAQSFSAANRRYGMLARMAARDHGRNLVVVFSTRKGCELPAEFEGTRVVDGDDTDLRFLDPQNVVVGLRAKGAARRDTSGFVVQV